MTDKGLESILKQCAESRKDYYKKRAKGIDRKKRVSLARKFANVPVGKTMEHEDIISALAKEYSEEESGKLFKEALERESLMIGTTETMMFRFLPFTCGSSIATGKTGAKVVCSQWNDSLTLNRDIWTAFTKRTLIQRFIMVHPVSGNAMRAAKIHLSKFYVKSFFESTSFFLDVTLIIWDHHKKWMPQSESSQRLDWKFTSVNGVHSVE